MMQMISFYHCLLYTLLNKHKNDWMKMHEFYGVGDVGSRGRLEKTWTEVVEDCWT